uniref:1-phosphatidylinositol 4-kinase n=2 Tax=Wollemia nobilis TaxID=56998 RepID=A0A0C9QX37_9CONI
MPSKGECPVQTQMPGAVGDGLKNVAGRTASRRRVFVQTDTGSVMGIELDRADNAQTLKKKMQLALKIPTEETALTFGDMVLKNDLSVVRNDAPLRLTRGHMQRSSSTPCLSPIGDNVQWRDRSGPVEIVGGLSCHSKVKKMIKQTVKAVESGVEPIPVQRGLGGAYYFRNTLGKSIAIVKPTDEEPFAPNNPKGFVGKILGQPGLKRSIRVGETGVREVAAYLLDHEEFAKVPPTVLVKISHSVFNINRGMTSITNANNKQTISKIASFQQYVEHDFDASDHGTSSFSVAAVHRIGILDVRVLNTDRHAGNILVKRSDTDFRKYPQMGETAELIPIDHGLCLPETLEDPYFEWLHWPQSSLTFSEEEIEYINRLEAFKDAEMLRRELPMMRESSLRILILCTIFLKTATAAGLCLAEIGGMMSREVYDVEDEASELELVCVQAKIEVDQHISAANYELIADMSVVSCEEKHFVDQFQFDMDYGDDFQNGRGYPNHEKADSSFGTKHDMCRSGSSNRLLKAPEGTGLSCLLLPQSPFPGHCIGKKNLQLSSTLNGAFNNNACNKFSAIHSLSPRISNGSSRLSCPSPRTPRGRPLTKLEEVPSSEEEEMQEGELFPEPKQDIGILKRQDPVLVRQCITPRTVSFSHRNQCNTSNIGVWKGFPRSMLTGDDPGVVTPNNIKFADMSKEEWSLFIDYFQNLLPEAIASRKQGKFNHRKRLGTSCQF